MLVGLLKVRIEDAMAPNTRMDRTSAIVLKEVVGLCHGQRLLTVQSPRKRVCKSLAGHAQNR